jgi:hypothetical protein
MGSGFRIVSMGASCAVVLLVSGTVTGQQTHVVDGRTWVLDDEEAELCTRALVECTPIFAKLRAESQRAARNERDLLEKLARAQSVGASEQEELASLRSEVTRLTQQLEVVQSSTSWWLTAPLRWLRSFFVTDADS